jgi:small neutral amino acid transporter SnatA (MarC family)
MEGALLIDFIPCRSPKATASVTYAPKITQKIAPRTVQGILRVIAFVLLCIGVQIAWNGVEAMVRSVAR